MIENLTVENYRSFKNYSLNGLKRVNLLTGYNSAGKSSLLEAVELLGSGGEPQTLLNISKRRQEYLLESDGVGGDISHFFSERNLRSVIRIGSPALKISLSYVQADTESPSEKADLIIVDRAAPGLEVPRIHIPVSDQGGFGLRSRRSRWGGSPSDDKTFGKVEYQGTRELENAKVAELWDEVLFSRSEHEPADSLRILDDRVESVAFLSSSPDRGRLHVGLKDAKRLTPIGSHGEGMQRLLMLAILLTTVKGGILLVDEIDTGLHYSVLADMWKLVIATAIKNDIQVFATTHSLDCLRGLHEACQANPEFASEISLQTIDRNLTQSIDTDAEGLAVSLAMGIEVR